MHIAVVTTSVADRKQTERLLDRANTALSDEIGTLYIDSYGDDTAFLHACMKYDLFLIDFEDMEHAYAIYQKILEHNAPGLVIFCLKEGAFLQDNYKNEKTDILKKPILTAELHAMLRKKHTIIDAQKKEKSLIEIRCEAGTVYVDKNDILYAKYREREHTVEYVFSNRETILYFGPIDDIYRNLGIYPEFEKRFKLFLVNTHHIVSETKTTLTMTNGDVLKRPLFTNPFSNIL